MRQMYMFLDIDMNEKLFTLKTCKNQIILV